MRTQDRLLQCCGRGLAVVCMLFACAGCARGPTRALWQTGASLDSETIQALAELARKQEDLHDLRAQGACVVSSREMVGRRKFNVTLLYRAPHDLAVRGFDSTGFAGQAFRLVAVGGTLDVEIAQTGAGLAEMLEEIPADSIARELLGPEDWTALNMRTVRILEKDRDGDHESLTLLINKRFGFFRRVTLDGPDWILRRSELLDRHGHVLVCVQWPEYARVNGVQVPLEIEAAFPLENLSMRFVLDESNVVPNTGLTQADLL